MNIFVYSDESGVFDQRHNDLFVFGGVMFLSSDDHEKWKRKYLSAERLIRKIDQISTDSEVKATFVSNKSKGKLYRLLNHTEKFGVVVHQKNVLPNIFNDKKTKQRFLDYVYKIGVKRKFEFLIEKGLVNPDEVKNIYFFVDEHSTATNGTYELQEGLEQEFKRGTYNWKYDRYYPPIFPKVESVQVSYCNSKKKTLIRSADIIANRLYFCSVKNKLDTVNTNEITITHLP